MRKFDPWPVFFRREFSRTWPFLVGFAVTGTLITKLTLGLTEEDAKNSPFVQKHRSVNHGNELSTKMFAKYVLHFDCQYGKSCDTCVLFIVWR